MHLGPSRATYYQARRGDSRDQRGTAGVLQGACLDDEKKQKKNANFFFFVHVTGTLCPQRDILKKQQNQDQKQTLIVKKLFFIDVTFIYFEFFENSKNFSKKFVFGSHCRYSSPTGTDRGEQAQSSHTSGRG